MNIYDFGAVGDGKANDTKALQNYIDSFESFGGKAIIPSGGVFKVAGLELRSNIELHLEINSKIIGCDKYEDYPIMNDSSSYKGAPLHCIIQAKSCQNIAITGFGTIDGNGMSFVQKKGKYIYKLDRYPRITMLFFEDVENLKVHDITITNGCYWTVHPVGCSKVQFRGLNIYQDLKMPNCDGLDPDHCKDVIISDCHIQTADDAIVIKNTKDFEEYGSTENIVITNCNIITTSSGLKIGTESFGNFKNIIFSNSTIMNANRGVSIQVRDGGEVSNCIFSNLNIKTRKFNTMWWGKGEPLAITSYQREENSILSKIHNISFNNIYASGENAIYLSGQKEGLIFDINFQNIDFVLKQSSSYKEQCYDNRPSFGSEEVGVYEDKLVGVYAQNTENIKMDNLNIKTDLNIEKFKFFKK